MEAKFNARNPFFRWALVARLDWPTRPWVRTMDKMTEAVRNYACGPLSEQVPLRLDKATHAWLSKRVEEHNARPDKHVDVNICSLIRGAIELYRFEVETPQED